MDISKIIMQTFICLFIGIPTYSQNFESITNDLISNNALTFQIQKDTLSSYVLYNTSNKNKITFNHSFYKKALTDHYFFGLDFTNNTLHIISLKNDETILKKEVRTFEILNHSLIIQYTEGRVEVWNDQIHLKQSFDKVKQLWTVEPTNEMVLISESNQIIRYNLSNHSIVLQENAESDVKSYKVVDYKNSKAIISFSKEDIVYTQWEKNKSKKHSIDVGELNTNQVKNWIQNSIRINEKFLFTYVIPSDNKSTKQNVEVYHSNVYGNDENFKKERKIKKNYYLYNLIDEKLFDLNKLYPDYDFFVSSLVSETIYAYQSISNHYKSQNDIELYYLNEQLELVYIDKVIGSSDMIYPLGDQNKILINTENHWKVFDEKKRHSKIVFTKEPMSSNVLSTENEFPQNKWYTLPNGNLIFKYKRDIMLFDKKLQSFKKLPIDNENHYEIKYSNFNSIPNVLLWGYDRQIASNDLLLQKRSNFFEKESLSTFNFKELKPLIEECECKILQIMDHNNGISYVKESYNLQPMLVYYNKVSGIEEVIYRSNFEDKDVMNYMSSYIRMDHEQNIKNGFLVRFPVNYDPNKVYPGIVNVYEQKFYSQNEYMPQNRALFYGFNWRDYVDNGYFVIEPDIYYDKDDIGGSIIHSIENVLKTLQKKKFGIDQNKLGIIGHSFGGYEVNHLITKTDFFKVAVSGASNSNLIDTSFSINQSTKRMNLWKVYGIQYRNYTTLFENKDKIIENSPIFHTKNLNTPLLLWHGKKDHLISYNESVKFFNAIDHLKKPVKLILFDNEGHVISDQSNEEFLRKEIFSWFEHYLK